MKLKFTLEVFVCSNVRLSTGKHLLCIVNFLFLLWEEVYVVNDPFFLTSRLSHVLFFLCFLLFAHTCLCVCVSLYVHDPSSPGWMLCNHSSVRSLWGTTVGAFFFITTSSESSFFWSFMSPHFQECLTILFAKTKLFCFYYKLIHMSVLHLSFHLILCFIPISFHNGQRVIMILSSLSLFHLFFVLLSRTIWMYSLWKHLISLYFSSYGLK